MKLTFFTNSLLEWLRGEAASHLSKYDSENSWIDDFSTGRTAIGESSFVVDPPPQLESFEKDNAQHDAENSKRVFLWLRGLTPAIAMEERLWAYLTHRVFQRYMQARWPLENEGVLHRRYLFEGKSFAALSRNGIARLWWAGYLTFDEKRTNPFELTEQLFVRQDIQVALLERSLGKCQRVRTAVLEYLQKNNTWLAQASFGSKIQFLVRELNLYGGVVVLDSLSSADIKKVLEDIGERLK